MKRYLLLCLLTLSCVWPALGQTFFSDEPLAHTYSIVARDPATGEMGVAVQSHWFSVGTLVSWGEAGVGVVATQSFVNPSFGPRGLALLRQGLTAPMALEALLALDPGREVRQLAILDAQGRVASFTGANCIPAAGHLTGDNYAVQANLMTGPEVWPAMAAAFEGSAGPLAERMLAALEAAEKAGGDIRGKQSAALLVVRAEPTGNVWEDRLVDLRVDDHSEPLVELRRLLRVHRAYGHMNAGDLAVEEGDLDRAMQEYGRAEAMFPDNLEMKYWHAVALVNVGQIEAALPLFKEVFGKDENWRELTGRLPAVGLLSVGDESLQRILEQ